MEDDWEDVFLQAAGGGGGGGDTSSSFVDLGANGGRNASHNYDPNSSSTVVAISTTTTTDQGPHTSSKRRRIELYSSDDHVNCRNHNNNDWNHHHDNDNSNDDDDAYFEMLGESFPNYNTTSSTSTSATTSKTTTTTLVPDCPNYVSFHNNNNFHSMVAGSSTTAANSSSTSCRFTTTECQHCGQASGYHQMRIDDSSSPATITTKHCAPQQQLFVTIRNLRCYSRIQLFHAVAMTTTTSTTPLLFTKYQDELKSVVRDYNNKHHHKPISRQTNLKYHDSLLCDITMRKVQGLMQHLHQMKRHIETTTTTTTTSTNQGRNGAIALTFIQHIQCITKCDDIYSRLYYNDCTTQRERRNLPCWSVPHPIRYYQEWCVRDNAHAVTTTNEHPLSRIYQYRMAETWSIFSAASSLVMRIMMNDDDENAKTRQLWRQCKYDWDLSCRDDLCHIYCYATISNTTLEQMILLLGKRYDCRQIVEMGAGTGYLAHWIQKLGRQRQCTKKNQDPTGFDVFAYDIANNATAESTNEYHADMAGYYYNVQQGDGRHGPKSKIIYDRHYRKHSNVALLLCYPPPDHDMGYDAIRNYHTYRPSSSSSSSSNARTHKIVIHIGEHNRGLTGTRKLDEYLLRHFQCVQRYPCMLYGSVDASEMTIWIDRPKEVNTPKTPPSILLPCSHCRDKEGTRRCQYLRSLVFCSNSCWQQHITKEPPTSSKKSRHSQQQERLLWKIIQIDQLDFENHEHFEPLYRF